MGAEPYGGSRRLEGFGVYANVLEGPESVFEGDGGLGPEALDELDGVFETGDSVIGVKTEGGIFFLVASDPDTEDEPTSGKLVQAG